MDAKGEESLLLSLLPCLLASLPPGLRCGPQAQSELSVGVRRLRDSGSERSILSPLAASDQDHKNPQNV